MTFVFTDCATCVFKYISCLGIIYKITIDFVHFSCCSAILLMRTNFAYDITGIPCSICVWFNLLKEVTRYAPPGGPNSFIFMQFSAKYLQNNRLLTTPTWSWCLLRKILDPPLNCKKITQKYKVFALSLNCTTPPRNPESATVYLRTATACTVIVKDRSIIPLRIHHCI